MTADTSAPMFGLLERLTAYAVSRRHTLARPVSIAAVELNAETVRIELVAQGLIFLVDGRYVAEALIQSTDSAETCCDVQLTAGPTAGRLAHSVARLLPDRWINTLLAEWFPGVRREGRAYVVSHRSLARALLHLGPLS